MRLGGAAGFWGFVGFVVSVDGEKEIVNNKCGRNRKENQNGCGNWSKVAERKEVEGEEGYEEKSYGHQRRN